MAKKLKRDMTMEEQLAHGPVDLPFLMLVVLLTGIGLIMVFSASYATALYDSSTAGNSPTYYFIRQGVFAVAGMAVLFVISKINYQSFRALSVLALLMTIVLLILVQTPLGFGRETVGAQRWIQLGPISFQPSEIAKLGVVLYFAARLSKRKDEKRKKLSPRSVWSGPWNFLERIGFLELVPYGLVLGIIAFLMLLQPHMSGTILILIGGAAVLLAAGIHIGWFITGGALVGGGLWAVINATSYMAARLEIWQNPWSDPLGSGFQTIQSLYAIGSGGLLGVGLGQSRQKFLYLPEPENDFIFSIVCEELGFVGASVILILFALLILRGYWIAIHARDRFGALVTVGFITMLAVQVFLNIAVVTNFIPTTGISLPFFSYGGTALMIQLAEMGIILSISRQIPATKRG